MRAFKVCEQIIECLLLEGYRLQIREADLAKCIKRVRGIDPRTVRNWIQTLLDFDYIEKVGAGIYQFNPMKVPELFTAIKKGVKLQ